MSFKSKQRAKHSHLFGDDPLSALSTPASDDPLFSPTMRTAARQGQGTPVNDPLGFASTANDRSSASPPPAKQQNGSSQPARATQSIFGEVDVSKLSGFSGKRATPLRTSSPLLDDDEDALFRAKNTERRRPPPPPRVPAGSVSSASSSTRSSLSEEKRPPSLDGQAASSRPAPPSSPPPSTRTSKDESPTLPANQQANTNNGSRQSSSLFSRFIKTKTPESTPPSVPAQQPAVSRPPPPPPPVPPRQSPKPASVTQPPPIPSRQRPGQTTSDEAKLPSTGSREVEPPKSTPQQQREEPQQQPEEADEKDQEIEDEATLAFASHVTFRTSPYRPSNYDPELVASLAIDSLDFQERPSMVPSASTPAPYGQQGQHQRSYTTPLMVDEATQEALNPWSAVAILEQPRLHLSASASSPLVKRPERTRTATASGAPTVSQSEIEPAKRTAFADLIASWNGQETHIPMPGNHTDDDEFVTLVAAEQRDIGFAGIQGSEEDDRQQGKNKETSVEWDVPEDQDNPWR